MTSAIPYTPAGYSPLTPWCTTGEYSRHEEGRSQKKFIEAVALRGEGLCTAEIARRLGVRRATLIAWFQHEHYRDHRGWAKGELRKYSHAVRERVISLKQARIDREKYFL